MLAWLQTILRHAPALVGAGLLVSCWAFLLWNMTVGQVAPVLSIRVTPPAGLREQVKPALSWATLRNGAVQRYVADRAGLLSPIYEKSLRLKNQAYYAWLGMAATPKVLVGPGGQLVETPYVREYCARNAEALAAKVDEAASRIRAIQDAVEARGQIFIYLLTPSKPAVYPSVLPADYPCDAPVADREAKLPFWRAALRRADVHVADAAAAVRDEAPAQPLFPPGGTHWNELGAALGAEALIAAVNAQRPSLAPLSYSVTWSTTPGHSDLDLVDMLGLLHFGVTSLSPHLSFGDARATVPCSPPVIVEIAGSFAFLLNEALRRSTCPPRISLWWYWDWHHFLFPPGAKQRLPVDAAERARDLATADIVVLEENEFLVPSSRHLRQLVSFILPMSPGNVAE